MPHKAIVSSLVCLMALLALASSAQSAGAVVLEASSSEVGWSSIRVSDAAAGEAKLTELRAGAAFELAGVVVGPTGSAELARALAWRCDTRTRQLQITDSSGATATTTLTTPSCKRRVAVRIAPARTRAGRRASVVLRDLWRSGGISARICRTPAGGLGRSCERIALPADGRSHSMRFELRMPGRWSVSVSTPGATVRRSIKVKPRSGRLRVLATGDSMIQLIDNSLKQRLRRVAPLRFRSDARISTGISKPELLNWMRHAAGSARGFKPDVTVMFLGANDGFNMDLPGGGLATCCGDAWVEEYARRARSMMRDYARGNRSHVYWLLLPAPRAASWRDLFRHVNAGILRAAKDSPTTHVVDLRRVFTPGGTFRQTIRWHGRSVTVRAPDGVHLNVAGARIAAEVVFRELRHDGVVVR